MNGLKACPNLPSPNKNKISDTQTNPTIIRDNKKNSIVINLFLFLILKNSKMLYSKKIPTFV